MICNILLIDWIVGIINSILKHPLDTPEWSVKKYPIFILRSEVPPLEMKSSNQLNQIRCCSLDKDLDQLVWIFNLPKVSIPILVNSGFNQPLSIPILAVCESNKCVNIFTKKKNTSHYILKKKFCSGECPTITTFLTYISPLSPDTQLKTLSTEGIDSSTSRQSQDTDPSQVEKYLAKHILESTQGGMLTVLLRMDESGVLHDMKKITLEDNIFTLRNLVIKKPSQEYPLKSEGHQKTTGPCSELTKTKLKERLEGKDADIVISEDDGNNSFLQKSEEQDGTTENSRNIPETSHKDDTTEDNTDMFDTEGQQTQDNTHISETSERPDETNEDYTEITKEFGTKGETIQEGTHLSDTSETRDEIKEDYTGNSNTFGTEGETTQDGTHISQTSEMQHQTESQDQTEMQDDTEIKFQIQIQDPSCRQGSTTEDQTKISHREDRKQTAQPIDVSHRQSTSTEYHTKILHREDTKKTSTTTSMSQARFHNRIPHKDIAQRRYKQNSTTSISQARCHNPIPHKDIAQRRYKQNSTTSISQARFLNRRPQKDCEHTRWKRSITRTSISGARFLN